jgi:predicted histidine transporter YuiF (NhaC family)
MFLFLILALAARKFFNLLLLLDPFGKRILTDDERMSTACFGVWLATLLTTIMSFMVFKSAAIVAPVAISLLVLLLIPLMRIFDVQPGARRIVLAIITAGTAALGVWMVVTSGLGGRSYENLSETEKSVAGVFILVCLLSIFYPHGRKE